MELERKITPSVALLKKNNKYIYGITELDRTVYNRKLQQNKTPHQIPEETQNPFKFQLYGYAQIMPRI